MGDQFGSVAHHDAGKAQHDGPADDDLVLPQRGQRKPRQASSRPGAPPAGQKRAMGGMAAVGGASRAPNVCAHR